MTNAFKQAVQAMFSCIDFIETCVIDQQLIPCVCSSLPLGFSYTEAGLEEDVQPFTLDFKFPIPAKLKIGAALVFRGKKFKIRQIQADSAAASCKVYLASTSQGV